MTGSNVEHMDVGAYALGVLGDWESTQFEMHLAGCSTCAHELEELTLVSSLLSHVDGNSIAVVEEYDRDGRSLDRMLNVVSMERKRARTNRVMSMAAAFVLVVGGIAYGLVGASPFAGNDGDSGDPGPRPSLGILTVDKKFEVKDKAGPYAKVEVDNAAWGSQVVLTLSKVKGPLVCQLVAVSPSGARSTAMTWTVEENGYGTMAKPDPLKASGSTALKPGDIDHFEVQTTNGSGATNTLVTIPVAS